MVVSRTAKQSRTSDTTVCHFIHERLILIERSLKACYKKSPYEKTTRIHSTTS